MNKWYVSIQNKAKGPYTDIQIREKISGGELKAETLSYKEGESDWLPLQKQDIWSPTFTPKHVLEIKDSKDWVLLVESPIKEGEYQQQGPFTDHEVKEKINIGEVHLKDFCWKAGMEGWKPLLEMPELGFPRKEKIEFVEDKANIEVLTETKVKEKIKTPFQNQMPEFVSPEDFKQHPKEDLAPIKRLRARLLPPIQNKEDQKFEIASYLALVVLLFAASFSVGYRYNKSILQGVSSIGEGITNLTQKILPAAPKVSYVFLRELPLTKGTILVKTDASPGTEVVAKVKLDGGTFVETKSGESYLSLRTNENGEAFLGLGMFKVMTGKTYKVTTRVGRLTAETAYIYSK